MVAKLICMYACRRLWRVDSTSTCNAKHTCGLHTKVHIVYTTDVETKRNVGIASFDKGSFPSHPWKSSEIDIQSDRRARGPTRHSYSVKRATLYDFMNRHERTPSYRTNIVCTLLFFFSTTFWESLTVFVVM